MTQTTYKTCTDGSIDFEHYMLKSRQARSQAAHAIFGDFANALRTLYDFALRLKNIEVRPIAGVKGLNEGQYQIITGGSGFSRR